MHMERAYTPIKGRANARLARRRSPAAPASGRLPGLLAAAGLKLTAGRAGRPRDGGPGIRY